jgi:thioredoxin reductase (NADPH)
VYYGATFMEGQLCKNEEVAVVGGGNSAGQAAVFLATIAKHVHMFVRGTGLADSMSRYLIRRIEGNERITLRTETELLLKIADVSGQSGLSNAQVQRGLGDGAQFGHDDKRSYVPQVHA